MARSSPEVVELVQSGKADIGFVYDAAVASVELASTPLFEDEMCLIITERGNLDGCIDLAVAPPRLVGFPPHYALRKMLDGSGIKLEFAAEAETIDAMLRLVAAGVGACVLPLRMPDSIVANCGLKKVSISRPTMKRRVAAIIRADRHASGLVNQLLEAATTRAFQGMA
jgi:DNA-binding transcriptional LysR family regulator